MGQRTLAVQSQHCLDLHLHPRKAVPPEHGVHHPFPADMPATVSSAIQAQRRSESCFGQGRAMKQIVLSAILSLHCHVLWQRHVLWICIPE